MSDEESRSILVDSVSSASSQAAKALVNIKRALCLLNHRLSSVLHLNSESVEIRDRRRNIVILFSQIIRRSIGVLSSQELKELKEYAFQRTSLKEMCSMSLDNGVREGLI